MHRRTMMAVGAALLSLFAASAAAEPPREPLDLNVATVEQLDTLPGVGRKRAEAIVERRTKRPFRRTLELMRIKGIGRRLFMRIKPYVRVGPPPAPPEQDPRHPLPAL